MFKLALASCSKIQDLPLQPAWADIQAQQPDALLLLGDNVYLDHDQHQQPGPLAAELDALYARQFAEPGFAVLLADLRARRAPLLAVYDDHDFLGDDRCGGDHDPALREAARAAFVRAFQAGPAGPDVYARHSLGLVDLILLDTRFYRSHPSRTVDPRNAMLGARQWAWLEQQLQASTATFLVVASATNLHNFGGQSWEQHPGAFQRLVGLLQGRAGALVVSGDAHRNAVYDDSGVVEIVSSAVARRGVVFGAERRNHGLLSFDAQGVQVDLRGLKVGNRFSFRIGLGHWVLP